MLCNAQPRQPSPRHLNPCMMGTAGSYRHRKRAVPGNVNAAPPAGGFDAVDDPHDPYYFPVDGSPPKHGTTSPNKRHRVVAKSDAHQNTLRDAPPGTSTLNNTPRAEAAPCSPPPVRSPTRPAVQLPPAAVRTAKPAPPPSQGGLLNPAAARTLFRSTSGGGAALAVVPPPAATTISEVWCTPVLQVSHVT